MIFRAHRYWPVLLPLASAPLMAAPQSLVPLGAPWKFLESVDGPPPAWTAPAFDDAAWPAGPAELGYGDADEATVTARADGSRPITTYFRKSFTVADPQPILGLTLRLLRDDGAVVYLNGVEVHRDNMPSGAIAHETLAGSGVSGALEKEFHSTSLPATALLAGQNTLAVEVHQSSATSSDLSFNLELIGVDTPSVTRGPYLQQGTPTSLIVRWRTNAPATGRVTFGPAATALNQSAQETSATTEHEVQLSGLTPETQYFYSIGTTTDVLAAGPEFSFVTPPPAGTARPTRIWVLGDSGTKNANAAAVRSAYDAFAGSSRTDLWLMLGDNAYDTGTDAEYQAAVFTMYPAMLRRSVLWPTIGNHDTAQSGDPPITIPYFNMFSLPTQGEAGGVPSGTEKYYSFDHAHLHFVCLDSMTSSRSAAGAMATWLKNDLAATLQPWIIAFWHHPPYTKGSHDSDKEKNLVEMRENILPLLEAGGVDLVMAGHSHSYERSFLLHGHYGASTTLTPSMKIDGGSGREGETGPYRKTETQSNAPGAVYITAGSSGQISGGPLNHPAMVVSLNKLGSMVLDVNGPRLDAKFLRENGKIDDAFTILKGDAKQ